MARQGQHNHRQPPQQWHIHTQQPTVSPARGATLPAGEAAGRASSGSYVVACEGAGAQNGVVEFLIGEEDAKAKAAIEEAAARAEEHAKARAAAEGAQEAAVSQAAAVRRRLRRRRAVQAATAEAATNARVEEEAQVKAEEELRDLQLAMLLQQEEAGAAPSLPRAEVAEGGRMPAPTRRGARRRRENGGAGSHESQHCLRRHLLSLDRDFTPEDYELLLRLDEHDPHNMSPTEHALAARRREEQELALRRLPVRRMVADEKVSAASSQFASAAAGGTNECSICLETMAPGAEIRTLPCLHTFHRECIDRWLLMPGSMPRCPVDQVEIASALA